MNDELLNRWAESRALPEERAGAIRRAILTDATPGLGAEWWRKVFAPVRSTMPRTLALNA